MASIVTVQPLMNSLSNNSGIAVFSLDFSALVGDWLIVHREKKRISRDFFGENLDTARAYGISVIWKMHKLARRILIKSDQNPSFFGAKLCIFWSGLNRFKPGLSLV